MIATIPTSIRFLVIVGFSASLLALSIDAYAQTRGAARPRPQHQVSRVGPARNGSFHSNQESADTRREAAPDRNPGQDRSDGPDMRQGDRLREQERAQQSDRLRDRERQGNEVHREDPRDERREDPPIRANGDGPDRRDERVDERRDYYDDRREDFIDNRRFARGLRYSSVWWTSNSCSNSDVVVVDGYSYYRCEDTWFGRTYYGGEVTYTVIDPPPGY
jgi:hypothetical protein